MERQDLVTATFDRLLERGRVGRSDVDAALAAAGHAPATEEEWCRATGQPTPRERRHGEGLSDRQYVLLAALHGVAVHGGVGAPEHGPDMAAINAELAGRGERPAGRAEVEAALERSRAALERRLSQGERQIALLRAVADLAAELGVAGGEPVLGALDRAGFRTERLFEGRWSPSATERRLLERVAGACLAREVDVANAARELLRRTLSDPALREAVLALALEHAAGERLPGLPDEGEDGEGITSATGRLRAAAAVELCRGLGPEEPAVVDLGAAKLERIVGEEIARHGPGREALAAAGRRMEAEPGAREAAVRERIARLVELEIAQGGLKERPDARTREVEAMP